MSDKKNELVISESLGDKGLKLAAAVTSAVPWLGGPVSNLLSGVAVERKFKRVEEVMRGIGDDLKNFKSEASEKYVLTEDFEELFERTLRHVSEERNEQKRLMYKNFLVGAIKSPGEPYLEQLRFLHLLEQIQPDHILVLNALRQPPESDPGPVGSPIQTLSERLGGMTDHHIEDIVSQLNDSRLTNLTSLHTMMTGRGAADLRRSITRFGQQFVQYLEA